MRRIQTTAMTLLLVGAAACADAAEEDTGFADEAAETPAIAPAAPAEDVEGVAGEGAGMLNVDTLAGAGAYLTDASGRALYLLEGEPEDRTTCEEDCATEWPPFLASRGAPSAGAESVREDLIGTLQRPDGRTQVTYGGHALYYYHDDTAAGQTSGQDKTDRWGEWYLVTPEGEPLEGN